MCRNIRCLIAILCLIQAASLAAETEVQVLKGKVRAVTPKEQLDISMGQKGVLAEGQKPVVSINDPLVQEVIQMYRWAQAEMQAGLNPIKEVNIAIHSLDDGNIWRYAGLMEWTNQTSQKLNDVNLGPVTTMDNLQIYDVQGNVLEYQAKDEGINSTRYTIHYPRPIEPNQQIRFIISSKNYNRISWSSKGPVWTTVYGWGGEKPLLHYTKVILPKSAILLSAYPTYSIIDRVEDRIAMTFRSYVNNPVLSVQQISFLWPDRDGSTLQDIPPRILGLGDPNEIRLAQDFHRGVASIRAGQRIADTSTPMNSLLTVASFIVHDLDKLESIWDSTPLIKAIFNNDKARAKQDLALERNYIDELDYHSGGVIPKDTKEGTVVPILLKLKGTVTPIAMSKCINKGGQWLPMFLETNLNAGIPGQTKLSKIKPDLSEATYKNLQPGQFMTRWLVLGPVNIPFKNEGYFPNEEAQKKDFDTDVLDPVQFKPTVRIGDKDYEWSLMSSDSGIPVLTNYSENWFYTMYAWAQVQMEQEMSTVLRISSFDNNRLKVWLNDKPVYQCWDNKVGAHRVPVTFKKGINQLVLEIQHGGGPWEFSCRMQNTQ